MTTQPATHTQTLGILGGGQLGRMLAQAALPLGIGCVFLEDSGTASEPCPAASLGKVYKTDEFAVFLEQADVFTLEFENTPLDSAQTISEQKTLYPPATALAVAQDRLKEKTTFVELGIDTVPFRAVNNQLELEQAAQELGLPLVLKTTRGGYDGKGQYVVKTEGDIAAAWQDLGNHAPLIAEGFIDFEREVSIIAVRGQDGEIKTYPLVENHHVDGILARTHAPAEDVANIDAAAIAAVSKLLNHFDYVGVLALELFVTQAGILANEIAPRVHNSGHYSIEGAMCSQFENHIRAVAGLPLGSTDCVYPSVMLNIISTHPSTADVLAVEGAHLHLYGKSERPARKLGHITLMPNNASTLPKQLAKLEALLKI